jgi:hypothetical protein
LDNNYEDKSKKKQKLITDYYGLGNDIQNVGRKRKHQEQEETLQKKLKPKVPNDELVEESSVDYATEDMNSSDSNDGTLMDSSVDVGQSRAPSELTGNAKQSDEQCGFDGCSNLGHNHRRYSVRGRPFVAHWCSEHKWCSRCHKYELTGKCEYSAKSNAKNNPKNNPKNNKQVNFTNHIPQNVSNARATLLVLH